MIGIALIIIGANSIIRSIITNQIMTQLITIESLRHPIIDNSALVATEPLSILGNVILIVIGIAFIFSDKILDWMAKK